MPRTLLTVLLLVAALFPGELRAEDEPEQQPCFEYDRDNKEGYFSYRIPALVVSNQGTLLAFCEGRKDSESDSGNIDLIMRRSIDGGRTWGAVQIVWDDAGNTCGNPCPVVDRKTGTICLLLTHNLGEDSQKLILENKSKGTRTVWNTRSTDDGETWTKPAEITRDVKQSDWTWFATGPGIGIQMASGRLVVPCDNYVTGTKVRQSHVIYSDDHGETWQLGGVVGPDCNECQVAERSDGSLLLNMRSYRGNHRRLVATSSDGGVTWSQPEEDPDLIEPVCQASLLRYSADSPVHLFSNPASERRENMTVRLSPDDGATWTAARVLYAGPAAYSCLTTIQEGLIGCLYECGDQGPYGRIVFARFSLSWLEQSKP